MFGKTRHFVSAALSLLVIGMTAPLNAANKFPVALPVSDTAELIHDRAAEAVLNGRFDEALRGFNEVLSLQPFNATAYYNRGNVRYFRRELELALQDYSSALKYRPDFAAAAMNRGIVLSSLNRFDEALADLDKAADLDPSNPEAFFNRAVIHVKRGAIEKAISDYDKIVRLDGANPDAEAVRFRFKALITRVDESGVVGQERSRRIVAEMDHARGVEQMLDLTYRSCIRLGDDSRGLSLLAKADGWKQVSDEGLAQIGTPSTRLTGGWTVTNRLGRIAIVQFNSTEEPRLTACVITARLGDEHWFEDFATLFASRFQSPKLVIRELEGRRVSRQVVVRSDRAQVEIILSQTTESRVFTLRTVHGKEDGSAR